MKIILNIKLLLLVLLQAGCIICSIVATPTLSTTITEDSSTDNNNSSHFDAEKELVKISTTCLNSTDLENLAGNVVRYGVSYLYAYIFLRETCMIIGRTELRAALNFAPLGPWKKFNHTYPNEDELASAPTIEAYFNLIEPKSLYTSLDGPYLLEKNMVDTLKFVDEKFPSIRLIYRNRFQEMLQSDAGAINREKIDSLKNELLKINRRMKNVLREMPDECWKLFNF